MMASWRGASCEELRRLYEKEGLGVAAIAEHFGVSPATVSSRLRRCGAIMRSGRFVRLPLPAADLRRLYGDERRTLRAIAAELGVSVGTVVAWRRELGLPPRGRGGRHPGPES